MKKIGFMDIAAEPELYVIEKKAEKLELKIKKRFSRTDDYDISFPEIPAGIDEFYLSLPLTSLNFRLVELPFSDKEKILSVLPFEIDGVILNGADNVILDGIILGSKEGKSNVLVVYTEKAALKKIIEKLETSNIYPRVITSIELRKITKDFSSEKLLSPINMNPDERIEAAMEEIRGSIINLRRGELSYTKDTAEIKKSLRWTVAVGLAAIVLAISLMVLKIVSARNEISAIQGDIGKIYSEVFPGDKNVVDGPYRFKARMKELKNKEDFLIGISPLDLLRNLSGVESGGITFNEISMDKERVLLKGEARSFSDIQRAKDLLANFLNEVNIADSKTSVQGRVLFTIAAKEKKVEEVF